MKEKKLKTRINAVRNNFYALRLVWKMCPRMVVHMACSRALYYFGWLFYSAFFMRYVINALQSGQLQYSPQWLYTTATFWEQ